MSKIISLAINNGITKLNVIDGISYFSGNDNRIELLQVYFIISKSYEDKNKENYLFGIVNNSNKKISKIILYKTGDDVSHELTAIASHNYTGKGEMEIYHALTDGFSHEPCGNLEIVYEDNIIYKISNIISDDKKTQDIPIRGNLTNPIGFTAGYYELEFGENNYENRIVEFFPDQNDISDLPDWLSVITQIIIKPYGIVWDVSWNQIQAYTLNNQNYIEFNKDETYILEVYIGTLKINEILWSPKNNFYGYWQLSQGGEAKKYTQL